MELKSAITALITPFIDGELDEEGLAYNIDYQIANGIHGILVLGTTGEASTLSASEEQRVISIAAKEAKGRVPLWVGTGSFCTQKTIEKTRRAKELGADVALIVTPYYNKPTQEGIYRHFEAIATAVEMPIVIYNIPGRCATNIEVATLLRLAGLPNIIGLKESSGNTNQAQDVIHTVVERYPHFLLFSGDDVLTLPMMSLGAVGIISVVSNLIPAQIVALTAAILKGEFAQAKKLHYQLLPLFKAAFIEPNPIAIKAAMSLCGMPSGECRLPLCQMGPDNLKLLHQLLLCMELITP
jgi:4-hydroxy-tetrahydrodipicolinate synthase